MAYIIGTKRPDTQGQPQQIVSGTPSMLGQGSTGVQAQTGQAAPSTFTNLQRYIEANQGNVGGLAKAIESKTQAVENPFQQAKTEAEIAKQNVQNAIQGRQQAETSVRSAVEKAKTAPSKLGAEEVKNIRNLATTFNYDPSQVLTPFTTSVTELGAKAQTSAAGLENLATREGQRQALMEARQAPRSSLGGLELDTFLLGASPEAQARVQALNLPTRPADLRNILTSFQENIPEFQKVQGLTAGDIQKQLSDEFNKFGLSQKPKLNIETPETMFGLDMTRLNKEIQNNPNVYDPNTSVGREKIRQLAKNYFRTKEQQLGEESAAKYKAISDLAGISKEEQSRFLNDINLTELEKLSKLDEYIRSITPLTQRPMDGIVGEIAEPGTITQSALAVPANAPTTTAPAPAINLEQALMNLQNIANTIGLNR